ncbi:MAG: GNAT family N-acetyltransferase, partial [Gemmobacter sp.]|nr:GNAT family N-acetyltransferase [Gemmobacter sp.]
MIRAAQPGEGALVNAALAALSADMGDRHRASDALIETALFGPSPALHALLAEEAGQVLGVAVFSPQVSTYRGEIG